jgi:hypothetical protein
LAKLSLNSFVIPHFVLKDGIIRYKARIWVGQNPDLHNQLISAMHNSTLGGLSGFPVTYIKIKQLIAWRGMKKDVQILSNLARCVSSPNLTESHWILLRDYLVL